MARQPNSPIEASARPRRSPLSGRNRLEVKNKEAGYEYRIVNDVDDRIELLQERGYEIDTNARVGAIGAKRVDNPTAPGSAAYVSVGQGVKAVVMRIRKEYADEDRVVKAQIVDETEQTLKRPKADYGSIEKGTRYSEG
jgi:hypothetical protein